MKQKDPVLFAFILDRRILPDSPPLRASVGDSAHWASFPPRLRPAWGVLLWWFGKQRPAVVISGCFGACRYHRSFRERTTVSFTRLCEALRKDRNHRGVVMRTNTEKDQTLLCSILFVSFRATHLFGAMGLCG